MGVLTDRANRHPARPTQVSILYIEAWGY